MDPLSPRQLEVANYSASGYDVNEIKAITGISDEMIINILDLPNVKRYRQITVDNIEMDVNIKRLSGGKKVLDKVIQGINKIVDTVDEKKWTMVHFKMFEWLTKEIPKLQKETKNIQATQINLNTKSESGGSSETDTLLNALPLSKKLEYFERSEAMLRAMVKEVHDSQVVEPTQ
jgi:hypothetical protein